MKLGTTELLLLLAVVVIIFGPTQIPRLTKMLGRSVKGFRDGINADATDADSDTDNAGEKKA